MQEKVKEFWKLYDQYILSMDPTMRPDLSGLLMQIEQKSKREQLLRPEKDWNHIAGWQVLRNEKFFFADNVKFQMLEGEIVVWCPHWDRDVFVTRNPTEEHMSGRLLKPGYKMDSNDRGDRSDIEWKEICTHHGLVDERGLYLPLYDLPTIMKFCDQEITKIRPRVKKALKEHLPVFIDLAPLEHL